MELWNYAKCCDSTQTMQTRLRLCILPLTRQSHSLEMFASVLEFLGDNLTRLEEYAAAWSCLCMLSPSCERWQKRSTRALARNSCRYTA